MSTEQRRRPVRRVGEILPEVAASLGLEEAFRAARAAATWQHLVGELVPGAAGASRLLEVRPPTLIVAADDPATGQEIRLHTSRLLEAFALAPGGRRLLELRVVVRSTGPRSSQDGLRGPGGGRV